MVKKCFMMILALGMQVGLVQAAEPVPSARHDIAFPVVLEIDRHELKTWLEEYLPLITAQQEEVLDEEQVSFLAEDTPNNITEMLRTRGYFNTKVQMTRTGKQFNIRVQTGEQTQVDNVSVLIAGDILQDEHLGEYYRDAMENWGLPVGGAFVQDDWNRGKSAILATVKRKKYPLARFDSTVAEVNPERNTANLSVNVESGSPVYFGELQIDGVERYPESVVRGLAQFSTGSPYDLDKLLDYQQAIEQDGHYSGASVQADFNNMQDNHVPVKVNVVEVKRKKLELGARYDSEYGAGGRFAYYYYNLFGRGYIGSVVAEGDRFERSLAVGVSQPRNTKGYFWTSNVSHQYSDIQFLQKYTTQAGLWYARERDGIESRVGVEYVGEEAKIHDAVEQDLGHSYATMLTASWKRQNIHSTLRPENGYYIDGKIGSSLGRLLSSSSMQMANLRAGYFFTPENKQWGTWAVRGQLGYVYTRDKTNVPNSLMFRTGGATSIRGYELNSIGLIRNQTVLPDRALAVASLEYQLPVSRNFSLATFHDVGGVHHRFKGMKWQHGSGLGLRWFSPIAPFSFDIAYGHSDKKIRWHISLGTRF